MYGREERASPRGKEKEKERKRRREREEVPVMKERDMSHKWMSHEGERDRVNRSLTCSTFTISFATT